MTHTTTEESKFTTHTRSNIIGTAVTAVRDRLVNNAKQAGYEYLVKDTFLVTTKINSLDEYLVEGEAIFAKIVPATQDEVREDEMPSPFDDGTPVPEPPAPVIWPKRSEEF